MINVQQKAADVREASRILYSATTEKKNLFLRKLAHYLKDQRRNIMIANRQDMEAAQEAGLSKVLLDRLLLNEERIEQMIAGVHAVIALPDPVGKIVSRKKRPNGLIIERMRVPLGAVGIIYEARPNVTIDASILCLKAGNAVLLRGGSEALCTNAALVSVLKVALEKTGLPASCVEFIDSPDRTAVTEMLKQDKYLDVIIPRGSQSFIRFVAENSTIPVIMHGEGNCHVFIDKSANLTMAEEIVFNAKVQRPSVCNATEKLLVHKSIAKKFLPRIAKRLQEAHVELRGDDYARSILPSILPATEEDWYREYLDLKIAVKVVSSVEEAIQHINKYGSHHSDAIVTGTKSVGDKFLREVDSAAVYVNASTRFTDGYEFGMGAEIGISTQKLHARGPMGLEELTCTKFIVRGKGQIRK
ncbi:MAG: glutamate-5-semialdehyde dehydrogenase [Bacteroidetes bacterium]|nr:glutamate-5-semialdehyde dehydrogenase [Bacteroidota bacterium]